MKKVIILLALIFVFSLVLAPVPAEAYEQDCWGQATAVFAQMGEMGEHASQEPTPREGLANLARQLYDDGNGVLAEPTLQALAAWLVSIDPNLTVDACMD